MKAFRFTLEAVRTVRQLQENEALERYARALAARQMARDSLEAIQERIMDDFALMRQLLAAGCCAARAAQAQNFHHSLEMTRRNGVAALEQAECRVNAACQTMLAARQQRAEKIAEWLMLAMEGERDLPPILKAAFLRQPLARVGWEAMTPTQRRNHLLGIFHYQSAKSRETRAIQTVEDALRVAKSKSFSAN